jgi:hypothetical protein
MRAHAMSWVLKPLETLLLAACLIIPSGVNAATIYAWTVADEIVKFDTNDPGTVQLVSVLTGLPAGMNNRQDLAWNPATPDVLYALGHQLGFQNFWLLKIDIDTGVVFDAPVIGSGIGMSGLTYIDNANYTGLVAAYRPLSNQETELCELDLNGVLSDCISTNVDNQNLAWDSRNDILHSRGAPAGGGQTSLWAIPDFPAGPQSNLGTIRAGTIAYSAFDDRIYNYDYGSDELFYIDTTDGGAPIQEVSLGIVVGNQLVSMVVIETVDGLTNVDIDIKPGGHRNPINLRSNGNIPVAILTSDTFDATQVNWETVRFGLSGATERHQRVHVKDADYDGDMDAVLHFKTRDTGILCGDTEASLTGETFNGEEFTGSDVIKIVKCPKEQPRCFQKRTRGLLRSAIFGSGREQRLSGWRSERQLSAGADLRAACFSGNTTEGPVCFA